MRPLSKNKIILFFLSLCICFLKDRAFCPNENENEIRALKMIEMAYQRSFGEASDVVDLKVSRDRYERERNEPDAKKYQEEFWESFYALKQMFFEVEKLAPEEMRKKFSVGDKGLGGLEARRKKREMESKAKPDLGRDKGAEKKPEDKKDQNADDGEKDPVGRKKKILRKGRAPFSPPAFKKEEEKKDAGKADADKGDKAEAKPLRPERPGRPSRPGRRGRGLRRPEEAEKKAEGDKKEKSSEGRAGGRPKRPERPKRPGRPERRRPQRPSRRGALEKKEPEKKDDEKAEGENDSQESSEN